MGKDRNSATSLALATKFPSGAMDFASANSIHEFLQSDDPFVPTVREAFQVIEDILDEYG
jgi:hypothetical protein